MRGEHVRNAFICIQKLVCDCGKLSFNEAGNEKKNCEALYFDKTDEPINASWGKQVIFV